MTLPSPIPTLRGWHGDLVRFGFTPAKLVRRIIPCRDAPRVLCNALPKSGTHLVERALCLHPGLYRPLVPTIRGRNFNQLGGLDGICGRLRPGQVVMTHLMYRPEFRDVLDRRAVRAVLSVRDPRDVLVSNAAFIPTLPTHRLYAYATALDGPATIMLRLIRGNTEPSIRPFAEALDGYAAWAGASAHVVRFEDLIGERGGGRDDDQAAALRRLYDYLELDVSDTRFERIRRRLYSTASPTFHRGAVGRWREAMTDEVREAFEEHCGDAARRLGYGDETGPG